MPAWRLDSSDDVAFLALERPPVNALDQGALDELERIVAEVGAAPAARALVLTSGLQGVFCSGGDLKHWRRIRDGREVGEAGRSVLDRIARLELPTIAALDGSVIGDGLGLALACDVRIASERASFRLPELGYGFIPGWGTIGRLVETVGRPEATHMLLTGRAYDADEALRVGLVHQRVRSDQLLGAVMELAHRVRSSSAAATRAAKRALRGEDEGDRFREVWGRADWEEGIDALLARRKPRFGRHGASE